MKINKEQENNLKKLIISLFAAISITLLSLFFVAIIMHFAEIGSEYSSPLSAIGLAVGCFFGGFIYSKLCGKKGLICGVTVSSILFGIITLISLSISLKSIGILTLIHLIVMLISGSMGGILGVNMNKKIKI